MEMMRAGQMHGVDDMRCVEVPVPSIDDGQVLVKTAMASICGSDLHVVCHGAGIGHSLPCPAGYPGHEGVGEVVDSRSPAVETGSRVLCFPQPPASHGFSEYQPMHARYTLALPDAATTQASEAELLMAQQFGTVIFAARQRPVDLVGKTALVLGQGSAGLFWSWWLKRCGATRVIVADPCEARLAASPGFGADEVLNPTDVDLEEALRELTDHGGGVFGADYVVEAVGRRETLYSSIELVRPDGELMWFGLPDSDDAVPISFARFFRKRLTASSTYGAQQEGDAVSFQTALDLIAGGEIDVSPLLSHVYPVEDINTAFQVANAPAGDGALKVSVTF